MSFKTHLLALSIAGFAAAAPAHASIDYGSTGNGELFLTLLDAAGLKSYALDLNIKMNDFLSSANAAAPGTTFLTYAADPLMTSFLASVLPANKPNLTYAIAAADNVGATATDVYRHIVSSNDIDYSAPVTNTKIKEFGTSIDAFLGDTNGSLGPVANSVVITDPSQVAYADSATWGSKLGGKANFTTTALIGTSNTMNLVAQTDGRFAMRNNPGVYGAIGPVVGGVPYPVYATLDNSGTLTFSVTPVPEAETYAMMLAGLGLVGFMARRRLNSRLA